MRPTTAQAEIEERLRADIAAARGRVLDRRIDGDDIVLLIDVPVPELVVEVIEVRAVKAMARRLRAALDDVSPRCTNTKFQPATLNRKQAAAFLGMDPRTFDAHVVPCIPPVVDRATGTRRFRRWARADLQRHRGAQPEPLRSTSSAASCSAPPLSPAHEPIAERIRKRMQK